MRVARSSLGCSSPLVVVAAAGAGEIALFALIRAPRPLPSTTFAIIRLEASEPNRRKQR